jgi:hypothetical protein
MIPIIDPDKRFAITSTEKAICERVAAKTGVSVQDVKQVYYSIGKMLTKEMPPLTEIEIVSKGNAVLKDFSSYTIPYLGAFIPNRKKIDMILDNLEYLRKPMTPEDYDKLHPLKAAHIKYKKKVMIDILKKRKVAERTREMHKLKKQE